jgi:hypothetical protein
MNVNRRQLLRSLAAIPLVAVLRPSSSDGIYDVQTMREDRMRRARVWMNGQNITKDFNIRYVDVNRGIARVLARRSDGSCYLDPAMGEIALAELRGRFVVTMDGPCA